jgi:anti-sigma regulatory factor (Ser/Thr protein kinase)
LGKTVQFTNQNEKIINYFKVICFPEGLIPENTSNWNEVLTKADSKTYLPIINFSTNLKEEQVIIREAVIGRFANLLASRFDIGKSVLTAISYFISEFTDNIVEHSGVNRGRLFYQYFPAKDYVEISIIDSGKTILGSYKEKNIEGIEDDKTAINNALSGLSTKGTERGRGIRTSNNLIREGMKGFVFLVSGKGMYINNGVTRPIILPIKKWNGTILTIIIPNILPEEIAIYDFIN